MIRPAVRSTFAAGPASHPLKVEVAWRSGKRSSISAEANFIYEIAERGATNPPAAPKSAKIRAKMRVVCNH